MKHSRLFALLLVAAVGFIFHGVTAMRIDEATTIMEIPIEKHLSITSVRFCPHKENCITVGLRENKKVTNWTYDLITKKRVDNLSFDEKKRIEERDFPTATAHTNVSKNFCVRIDERKLIVSEKETKTPLCTVTHKAPIALAVANKSATRIITASTDNKIKISSTPNPIIFLCGQYKKILPYTPKNCGILDSSILLQTMIKDCGGNYGDQPICQLGTFQRFEDMYRCLKSVYFNNKDGLLFPINMRNLCQRLELCSYFDIQNETLNSVAIIGKYIANHYRQNDVADIKKLLPLELQNVIARHKIKKVTNFIDNHFFKIHEGAPLSIEFSRCGTKVIVVSTIYDKQVFDLLRRKFIGGFNTAGYCLRIALFEETGFKYITGLYNSSLAVTFDYPNEKKTTPRLIGHTAPVVSIALDDLEKTCITKSKDGTAKIWDVKTGKCLSTLYNPKGAITAFGLSRDHKLAFLGHRKGLVTMWDCATGNCIKTVTKDKCSHPVSIAFNNNSTKVAVGFMDGKIRFYRVDDAEKNELLSKLTIDQAGFIAEEMHKAMIHKSPLKLKGGTEQYEIFSTFTPKALTYLGSRLSSIEVTTFFNSTH